MPWSERLGDGPRLPVSRSHLVTFNQQHSNHDLMNRCWIALNSARHGARCAPGVIASPSKSCEKSWPTSAGWVIHGHSEARARSSRRSPSSTGNMMRRERRAYLNKMRVKAGISIFFVPSPNAFITLQHRLRQRAVIPVDFPRGRHPTTSFNLMKG